MASPLPLVPMGGGWNAYGTRSTPAPPELDDSGLHLTPMALKVHYTFDKDSKVNCLARHPQTIPVQTAHIDENTSIGLVDLRACLHAIIECSPELAGQESDYTIYALDYSEQDTPLVGQGMLSWAMQSMRGDSNGQQPKMVTGRVTRNVFGVFGGGSRETLEVKLKLTEAAKLQRPEPQRTFDMQPSRSMDAALTPTGAAEWNSFMQSNPQLGQQSQTFRVASPAFSQGHQAPAFERASSFGPSQHMLPAPETQRIAPVLVEQSQLAALAPAGGVSRPSSQCSNKPPRKRPSRQPSGRPRGRPRKKPAEGHTSGYEDGTEGEEVPPPKKRAKTTTISKANANAFGSEPESLRVAASISGSLRNFRPIASNSEAGPGSNLQEIPRAPTPVPLKTGRGGVPGRGGRPTNLLRRQSTMNREISQTDSLPYSESRLALSPSQQDGRSPDSGAPTPNYSEGSPADMGSSPPVPRPTTFIRSSPPPSSPILPPMPQSLPALSGFMSTDMDDLFGEEPLQHDMLPYQRDFNEPTSVTGTPHENFWMEGGPVGDRGMVNIRNQNTPQPTSAAMIASEMSYLPHAKPALVQAPTRRQPAARKRATKAAGRGQAAPTPPPTTDAVEKPASPTVATKPVSPVSFTEPAAGVDSAADDEPMADAEISAGAELECDTEPTVEAAELESMPLPELSGRHHSAEADEHARCLTKPNLEAQNASLEQELETTQPAAASDTAQRDCGAPMEVSHMPPEVANPTHVIQRRQLGRSQSAGVLILPTMPASEPAGPTRLSRSIDAEPELTCSEVPAVLKRSASMGPFLPHVAASDPAEYRIPSDHLPQAAVIPQSEEVLELQPSAETAASRYNKNAVKKIAIKQRLEEAIKRGEMPPYCSNCGAIQTPTWRKIWVQDREGIPQYVEYSEKPGHVTAIEILKRDEDERPTLYRLVKKSLADDEEQSAWQELLLCNPCGIWLTKCKMHRPPDRWITDAQRLGHNRRKRAASGDGNTKSKKSRTKSDTQMDPTSEAYLFTDAAGPAEGSTPYPTDAAPEVSQGSRPQSRCSEAAEAGEATNGSDLGETGSQTQPISVHGRGSSTAKCPIELAFDDEMGSTRRLLFPSPKKDDAGRILGELDVNIVKTTPTCVLQKEMSTGKENLAIEDDGLSAESPDELEAFFRSPPARPSTPPPNAKPSAEDACFKTPTRPTPCHRPITRSVSRSIRSAKGLASPLQLDILQQTPTRSTPRSVRHQLSSTGLRRSPRNLGGPLDVTLDTPISRSIKELLSENNGFGLEDQELDLSCLAPMDDVDDIDWSKVLSNDHPRPDSPGQVWIGFDYESSADIVDEWTREVEAGARKARG